MDKKDREKLLDVAGFLQGWLAFKKPVPPDEVVRLHFDLVMEVLAKNNEAIRLSVSKSFYCADVLGKCNKQCEDCKDIEKD